MTRGRGRCRRGERLRMGAPHGHWRTSTFVVGLGLRGWVAPLAVVLGPMADNGSLSGGPVNCEVFEAWVEQALVLELRRGDVVALDNLSSHKGVRTRAPIEAASARLLFLPPHNPDFNPIANASAKLKTLLRKTAERTVDGLWSALGRGLKAFSPAERAKHLTARGYGPG